MKARNLLKSTHKCSVFAVVLACFASLASAQTAESVPTVDKATIPASAVDGWTGGESRRPTRLPRVQVNPVQANPVQAPSADFTERRPVKRASESVWKTKMAFERLDFQTSDDGSHRSEPGDLQKCSAESLASGVQSLDGVTTLITDSPSGNVRWLRTNSSTASVNKARRLIDQAVLEYGTRAWLSAESTAWEALRCAAESVDLTNREIAKVQLGIRNRNASKRLQRARTAIREARDFSGIYGDADGDTIARMAVSHTTDVLDHVPCDTLSGQDASDRYLDAARVSLAGIASKSVEAAQSMDVLAAIYLQQDDAKKLHGATALCLRRAALQGQPNNASLASRLGMQLLDVGLIREASWALKHSLSLEQDEATTHAYIAVLQRSGRQVEATEVWARLQAEQPSTSTSGPRVPEITELSPSEFATISRPVMTTPAENRINAAFASVKQPVTLEPSSAATERIADRTTDAVPEDEKASKPNLFQRFIGSVKKIW